MSFIVEDGTGLANSTAYLSVADFTAYWAFGGSLGIKTITQTTAEIQSAIVVATRYIEQNFKAKGVVKNLTQALQFPTVGAYDRRGRPIDSSSVPKLVKDACSEYAYQQLTGLADGGLQPVPSKLGVVASESKTLDGVGGKSTTYQPGTGAYTTRKYPYADSLLNGIMVGGSGLSGKLSRSL